MQLLILSSDHWATHAGQVVKVIALCTLFVAMPVFNTAFANGVPVKAGDIFIDVGIGSGYTRDNQILHFNPNGKLLDTFDFGTSYDTYWDMRFNKSSTLYTVFQNTVVKNGGVVTIDKNGGDPGSFGDGVYSYPVSVALDRAGNVYVGQDSPNSGTYPSILKFDQGGKLLATYSVNKDPSSGFGVLYAALAPDQCTLRYTSAGDSILQYNVCTHTQLPDLVTSIPEPVEYGSGAEVLYGIQQLPSGDLLLGTWDTVLLLTSSGDVIKNYKDPGVTKYGWYPANIALDPPL